MSANEKTRPYGFTVTLVQANTEYSLIAVATWDSTPAPSTLLGALHLSFQCRTGADVRFAFVTGKVATPTDPYLTLKAGTVFNAPEKLCLTGVSTVFLAGAAGLIVEGIAWLQG